MSTHSSVKLAVSPAVKSAITSASKAHATYGVRVSKVRDILIRAGWLPEQAKHAARKHLENHYRSVLVA